jgi:hypothetical protein
MAKIGQLDKSDAHIIITKINFLTKKNNFVLN